MTEKTRYSAGMRAVLLDLLRRDDQPVIHLADVQSHFRHMDTRYQMTPAQRQTLSRIARRTVRSLEARGDVSVYEGDHPDWVDPPGEAFPWWAVGKSCLYARLTAQGRLQAERFRLADDDKEGRRRATLSQEALAMENHQRAALDKLTAKIARLY